MFYFQKSFDFFYGGRRMIVEVAVALQSGGLVTVHEVVEIGLGVVEKADSLLPLCG